MERLPKVLKPGTVRYNCSAESWPGGDPKNACDKSKDCKKCNKAVTRCFLKCGFSKKDDPNKPNYYCAKEHRFVKMPGDFPDRKKAEKACRYDHSKDYKTPLPNGATF